MSVVKGKLVQEDWAAVKQDVDAVAESGEGAEISTEESPHSHKACHGTILSVSSINMALFKA